MFFQVKLLDEERLESNLPDVDGVWRNLVRHFGRHQNSTKKDLSELSKVTMLPSQHAVTQRARETAAPRTRGSFVLCSLVCGTLRVCTTLE